ncbi:MAG: peptidylprolyl isomerase [Oceanococcaceae bacterium]
MSWRAVAAEPLLQFVVAAALLLGLGSLWSSGEEAASVDTIVVPADLAGDAREAWIDRALLIAEARRRGLERNDSLIERQLQMKMQALLDAEHARVTPSETELASWYASRQAHYADAERRDITQVFVPRSLLTTEAREALERVAQRVQAGVAGAEAVAGEPLPALQHLQGQTAEMLRRRYGEVLATPVFAATGEWIGPVESGLGWHLLQVTDVTPVRPRPLSAVRDQVIVDWREQQRQAQRDAQLASWRARYRIIDGRAE